MANWKNNGKLKLMIIVGTRPETTMKNSHLLLCQCCPFVTPGFETFTLNWP